MPTLNWIGKEQVVNHDKEVPFRLLKKIKSASLGENSQNLIIHGDNLEALKALIPYYHNKIKCIYIDPPYNTGNEGWIYNDKVNSPKIKKWLGKVVGGEAEDLCRHDKWLCMMYPRLKLLRELLSEDGVIFVSIDDNEQANLKQLMDDIFGEGNFLATVVWQKKTSPQNDAKYFSDMHDFILVYAKKKKTKNTDNGFSLNLLERTERHNANYKNIDNDPRGPWMRSDFSVKTYSKDYDYVITLPSGKKVKPPRGRCWMTSKERYQELVKDRRIWFGKNNNCVPALKRFLSEVKQGITPVTVWFANEVGTNNEARRELKEIFPEVQLPFETPKPVSLIKRIIQLASNKDSLILDSFAGAGTTAHAALRLNKEDGGYRKFILVELEDIVAKGITAERVKRAIQSENLEVGFEFCELDKPLFDAEGQIDEDCSFEQLAQYIFFTETQTNLEKKQVSGNFIGSFSGSEYYLIFKEKGVNVLDRAFLKKLKRDSNKKVIYADKCLVDEEDLAKRNIVFKQIPYEVKVY